MDEEIGFIINPQEEKNVVPTLVLFLLKRRWWEGTFEIKIRLKFLKIENPPSPPICRDTLQTLYCNIKQFCWQFW
jgi:hypothetical protein